MDDDLRLYMMIVEQIDVHIVVFVILRLESDRVGQADGTKVQIVGHVSHLSTKIEELFQLKASSFFDDLSRTLIATRKEFSQVMQFLAGLVPVSGEVA